MQQKGKPPTLLLFFFFILGEMTATALRLPSGSPHFNYLTEIYVTVHDRFGDYNEFKMTIQVRSQGISINLVLVGSSCSFCPLYMFTRF
jgi:hypothetical protein